MACISKTIIDKENAANPLEKLNKRLMIFDDYQTQNKTYKLTGDI